MTYPDLEHGTTQRVTYPSVGLDGSAVELTGLLHLPRTPAPDEGWPVVTYGHMTTGAGERSAPSLGHPEHPEWRRMSQGDALCERLLAGGAAVLRPDYLGIGSDGTHPYLIGEPLGRSMVDMVVARRDLDARLGDRWVAAGHSEGSMAALYAASPALADARPVPLLGVAAFAPVTRMHLTIGTMAKVAVVPPGVGVVPSLIGLMLLGASTADEQVTALIDQGHLGSRAEAVWDHLQTRCLTELAARDSWGAIAPTKIASPELYAALFEVMRVNEVARLHPQAPVRIDSGRFDEVAPAHLTAKLAARYRREGIEVTHQVWPTHHSGVMHERWAPGPAAEWILERLRNAGP